MEANGLGELIYSISKQRGKKYLGLKDLEAYLEMGCEWNGPRERWVRSRELEEEEEKSGRQERDSGGRRRQGGNKEK